MYVEDQVEGLRRMKREENYNGARKLKPRSKQVTRFCITSGKGGVGKSNFALNTAIVLASFNKKVLLVDADTNLANLDILIGLRTELTLSDAITGEYTIHEVIVRGPGGIDILPGSSGVLAMIDLDNQVQQRLVEGFAEIEEQYDYMVIDTGAGLNASILGYVIASDEVIIITNTEPTSFADAYAMIKAISHESPTHRIRILINMVSSNTEATKVYDGLNLVVNNFLSMQVEYLGSLPSDTCISQSVSRQLPFVLEYPKSPASRALRMVVRKLLLAKTKQPGGPEQTLLAKILKSNKRT